MAVLAVLYYQRRLNPSYPDVTLSELEERMGFPRDYLDFTLWYLEKKRYVARTDNATFSLNAEGVDCVERERILLPVLNGLLTSNSGTVENATDGYAGTASNASAENPSTLSAESKTSRTAWADERRAGDDRRRGAPDLRFNKVERRQNSPDRRAKGKGRKAAD